MIELENLASPTFASNLRRLQCTVVEGFADMAAAEAMRAIYFATVYDSNFEAVALDSDGFRSGPFNIFSYEEWEDAIDTATDGLGASFAGIAVPINYPEPLDVPGALPCRDIFVCIGVERLGYKKTAMPLYQDGDQFVCTGRWFPSSLETPADALITPVRRAVVHHG